ncbi:uncharacterized protein HKW66_Vig0172520 [Vigna angularis]|uniref:Uncharacterized protein n=1 Tax=Phaseolus angularis TaxID=3914 RepID=A0A8T0JRU6_PHAAN|nr:uncharacterized protein HKW66_Vig0172520 [Vigna angularis]
MSASDSGSGKRRRGRGVTRVADVTSGRVDGQRRHVDIDPKSGHPLGPNDDRFRSYLGNLAKSHVSILHACWDDVAEVDKNLLWQDIQFRASREFEEWKGKRLAAQERQRLNDAPHLLSRGGYAKLEKKLRKSRADALGLESSDLAPTPARVLEEKLHSMTQGNMGADETPTPPRVSTRGSCSAVDPTQYSGQYELLFTRPQKQPIHDTVIAEDDEMVEAEDDPLSKLMTKLPRLKKASLELYWDLRVFGC